MDVASIWIAIAGLLTTTIASAIGFYYSHKSQRSTLREQLHAKQIDILIEFSVSSTKVQHVADALQKNLGADAESQRQLDGYWDGACLEMLDIVQKGAVVLPAELYAALTAFRGCAHDFEDALLAGENIGKAYYALMGAGSHATMLARELVGADNLTRESIKLHNPKGYKTIQDVGRAALGRVSQALLRPRRRKGSGNES